MSFQIKAGVTALALILAPLAAAAHHKPGHDGGNSRGRASQEERGNRSQDRAAREERRQQVESDDEAEETEAEEEAAVGGRPCAWGLAGRDTPCVPPGQAAKGVSTDDWIGVPQTVVDEDADLSAAENFALLGNTDRLPELEEGQSYALIGDAVIVVEERDVLVADGETPITTYDYVSTYGRAAFPGQLGY